MKKLSYIFVFAICLFLISGVNAEETNNYSTFTINKVDDEGKPVEGAEFEVYQEIPIYYGGCKTQASYDFENDILYTGAMFNLSRLDELDVDKNLYYFFLRYDNKLIDINGKEEDIKNVLNNDTSIFSTKLSAVDFSKYITKAYIIPINFIKTNIDYEFDINELPFEELNKYEITDLSSISFIGTEAAIKSCTTKIPIFKIKVMINKTITDTNGKIEMKLLNEQGLLEVINRFDVGRLFADYGELTVKETKVPKGYELSDKEYKANISDGSITIVNNKIKEEPKNDIIKEIVNVPPTSASALIAIITGGVLLIISLISLIYINKKYK